MPEGLPRGAERTGRDWMVLVPKWILILSIPVAAVAAGMASDGDRESIPVAVGAGVVAVASVVLLILAWSEGGWDRIRGTTLFGGKPSPTYEETAREMASGPAGIRTLVLVGSLAALGGAGLLMMQPAKPYRKAAVKLGAAGVAGLWLWFRSRRKAGEGE